jgi:hypothetical protein
MFELCLKTRSIVYSLVPSNLSSLYNDAIIGLEAKVLLPVQSSYELLFDSTWIQFDWKWEDKSSECTFTEWETIKKSDTLLYWKEYSSHLVEWSASASRWLLGMFMFDLGTGTCLRNDGLYTNYTTLCPRCSCLVNRKMRFHKTIKLNMFRSLISWRYQNIRQMFTNSIQ